MSYKPTDTLKDHEVFREFQQVASELQELRKMLIAFRAPYKPREGQFLIADGTTWDPLGDGEKRPIWFDGTDWQPFGSTGGGGAVDSVNGQTGVVVLELADLADVNAPTPVDLDVLTYDAGSGKWIPYAVPSGGLLALDDLTDVDAPTPSDGDVLTYDAGDGLWLPQAPAADESGAMIKLDSVTLGSTAATVSFNSIPQTYTHLLLTYVANSGSAVEQMYMQFNGDTGANYDYGMNFGYSGAGFSGGGGASATSQVEIASMPGGSFGTQGISGRIQIPYYTNTTFNKEAFNHTGRRDSNAFYNQNYHMNWRNSAAITDILLGVVSTAFVVGSRFDLYGIK